MSNSSEGPQQILRFSRGRPFGTSDVRPFVRGQSSHDLKLKLSPELLRVPCVWCHQFHADAAFQGLGNLHSPHVDSIISSWLRLGWQPRREVALFSRSGLLPFCTSIGPSVSFSIWQRSYQGSCNGWATTPGRAATWSAGPEWLNWNHQNH